MTIIPVDYRLTAAVAVIGLLLVAGGVQTWRLHSLEADYATLQTSVATGKAARATAYAQDSDQTATKEQSHAAATIQAADQFNAGAPARETALAGQLADARRLLDSSEQRATRYRAQAKADAEARSSLADRATALDASLAEGRIVVAELRSVVERRDAEVKLLADLLDADAALLAVEQ